MILLKNFKQNKLFNYKSLQILLILGFIFSYILLVYFSIFLRDLPSEIDDSSIYIFKTFQFKNCFFQNCELLLDLKSQLTKEITNEGLTTAQIWQKEIPKLTFFHIYHFSYTLFHFLVDLFTKDLFLSYNIQKILIFLFVPFALYKFQKIYLTTRESIIFFVLLLFFQFPEQGLMSATATSLVYLVTLILFILESKYRSTNYLIFFLSIILVTIHDFGFICIFFFYLFKLIKSKSLKIFNILDYIFFVIVIILFFLISYLTTPEFKSSSEIHSTIGLYNIVKYNIKFLYLYIENNLFITLTIFGSLILLRGNSKIKNLYPLIISTFLILIIGLFHYGGIYHHHVLLKRLIFFVNLSYFLLISISIFVFLDKYKNLLLSLLIFLTISYFKYNQIENFYLKLKSLHNKENYFYDRNEISKYKNIFENKKIFFDDFTYSSLSYTMPLLFFNNSIYGKKNGLSYLCIYYDNECFYKDYDYIIQPSFRTYFIKTLWSYHNTDLTLKLYKGNNLIYQIQENSNKINNLLNVSNSKINLYLNSSDKAIFIKNNNELIIKYPNNNSLIKLYENDLFNVFTNNVN